jgi:hypothetical protein
MTQTEGLAIISALSGGLEKSVGNQPPLGQSQLGVPEILWEPNKSASNAVDQ